MKALTFSAALLLLEITVAVLSESGSCPHGERILDMRISDAGKRTVVEKHNEIRKMIQDGTVPGQPRGKNIKEIEYDEELSHLARKVSERCEMNHVLGTHSRFGQVGQNLYISYTSEESCAQNWSDAIDSWYSEHENFKYPGPGSNGVTGHYTQVIWHSTTSIGCDFVCYYDFNQPHFPYAKLYTCNYGPGGNIVGEPPYELAD